MIPIDQALTAIKERFESKIMPEPMSGCWLWLSAVKNENHPYGQFSIGNKKHLAHRLSYQLYKGPIPEGFSVCHNCDNPNCVNPDHLFLGTHGDNMKDMIKKGRGNKARGSSGGRAILSEDDVEKIRLEHSNGATKTSLGRKYGVDHSTIHLIIIKKTWARV